MHWQSIVRSHQPRTLCFCLASCFSPSMRFAYDTEIRRDCQGAARWWKVVGRVALLSGGRQRGCVSEGWAVARLRF